MEPEAQKPGPSPAAALTAAIRKRDKLQDELRAIEKQVYDLETSYLHDSSQTGNVLKGFEGFLSSSRAQQISNDLESFKPKTDFSHYHRSPLQRLMNTLDEMVLSSDLPLINTCNIL